ERVLARGGGIQLAAEAVEDLGDLDRAVPVGALEQEVLDEVGHARLAALLVPRAGADPEANLGGANVIEALRDHPLARVQLGQHPVLHRGSVVPVAQYRFLTTWIFDAPIERVWERLHDPARWPEWWRGLERTDIRDEN